MAGTASPPPACCPPPARRALGHTAGRQISSKTQTHVARSREDPPAKDPEPAVEGVPQVTPFPQCEGPVPIASATVCILLMSVPSGSGLPTESSGKRVAPAPILPFVLGLPCCSLNIWLLYFTWHSVAVRDETLPWCQPSPTPNPISSLQPPPSTGSPFPGFLGVPMADGGVCSALC